MIKPSYFSSSALSLVALAALTLGSACGDESKPNKGNDMTTGDGDAQGDGDQGSMDASTGGDGDDQQPGDGDGDDDPLTDEDGGLIDVDAAPDGEVVDPFEDLPDGGTDGAVLSEDEKLALAMEAKLRKCGVVVGDGKFNVGLVEDELDRCIGRCITLKQTFCTHLYDRLCKGEVTPYATCLLGCKSVSTADFYTCGSTTTKIPHGNVCDDEALTPVCPNKEDEVGCAKFTCTNGDMVSAKFVCDGVSVKGSKVSVGGCRDGSDEEQGCATFCPAKP